MLFDMFKACDEIENSHKSDIFFIRKDFYFMRAQHVLSYHRPFCSIIASPGPFISPDTGEAKCAVYPRSLFHFFVLVYYGNWTRLLGHSVQVT